MKPTKKAVSLATASALTIGILLGATPVTHASTTPSTTPQSQNVTSKQMAKYLKTLNDLKVSYKENDESMTSAYNELLADIKLFETYKYTGIDGLKKKTATFETKMDKSRKDNIAIDLKQVTTTLETYVQKNDAKNTELYFNSVKKKLETAVTVHENLTYEIEDYAYDISTQIDEENEIFIRKALPKQFEKFEVEGTKTFARLMNQMLSTNGVLTEAYRLFNVDYTLKKKIERDLELLVEKHLSDTMTEDFITVTVELQEAIDDRNISKAKVALNKSMVELQKINKELDHFDAVINWYKKKLPSKFPSYLKK